MVCSMVKKGLLGAALGAGTLFLVFGTSAPSYVKTAFHKVRQNVKESVDPQFEIDRARQDIENLKPMFDQNKETLARAEVEAENLESEVGTMQANLDKAKQTILAMQHKLKTGDFRLTGHVADTADDIKAELAQRLDHYDYTSDTLKQKQEILKAKRKIIQAAHEQLETLRAAEVDAPGQAGQHRGPAAGPRGDPDQERVQLRRQRPVPRQADDLRAGEAAQRDGAPGRDRWALRRPG